MKTFIAAALALFLGSPAFAGSAAFEAIASGTNTTAAMHCSTGCSIDATGSGSITATAMAAGSVTALMLQQAAADLGDADVTVDLTNSHAARATNLTIDGAYTGAGTGLTGTAASLSIGGNAATATSVPFSGASAGTNTAALLVGTGGSLGVTGTGTIDPVMSAAHVLTWTGRSLITSSADGTIGMTNTAGTGFTTLVLGTDNFINRSAAGKIFLGNASGNNSAAILGVDRLFVGQAGVGWGFDVSGNLGKFLAGANAYLGWTASADPNGQAGDTFLTRGGAAATVQLGAADAASPVAQTFQTQSTTSNDTAGQPFVIKVSQGKGTGAGGAHTVKTGYSVGSGATPNVTGDRQVNSSTWTTLTESTPTAIATLTYAASTPVGADFFVTIHAADASNNQGVSYRVRVNSIRDAAGNTQSTVGVVDDSVTLPLAAGSGTLAASFTVTEGAGAVTLNCTAVSSLTQTTLRANFQANGNGPVAIAAQ